MVPIEFEGQLLFDKKVKLLEFLLSSVLYLLPTFCGIMTGDSSPPHASGVVSDFAVLLGSLTTFYVGCGIPRYL